MCKSTEELRTETAVTVETDAKHKQAFFAYTGAALFGASTPFFRVREFSGKKY